LSEKRCFELLLAVSGVGPKAALSILSACSPESLALAIINNDERALTMAPGVGKKLAQRVILELKDKMSQNSMDLRAGGFVPPGAAGTAGATGTKEGDAAAALGVLGYTPAEISAALRGMDTQGLTVEEIIRLVLKNSLR